MLWNLPFLTLVQKLINHKKWVQYKFATEDLPFASLYLWSFLAILVCSMFYPCISSKWAVWRLRERKEKEPPSASQLIISWSACPHSPHNPIFQTLDLCISYSCILVFRDVVICVSGPQSPYSTQFFKLKVLYFHPYYPSPPSTSLFLQKISRKSTHRCASLLDYLDDLGNRDYRYYLVTHSKLQIKRS